MDDIPPEFFKSLCTDIDYPLACVDPDSKFQWVNHAFERLVGYSVVELIGKTWMSITKQADVGGDLAGVEEVIAGKISEYRMEKAYLHKRGHEVPIELTVRRWPINPVEHLVYFRVETPPQRATRPELDQVHNELLGIIGDLRIRVSDAEIKAAEKVRIEMGDRWRDGDKTGRDKTTNDVSMIKYMMAAVGVLAAVVAWMAYYVATMGTNTTPVPPTVQDSVNE